MKFDLIIKDQDTLQNFTATIAQNCVLVRYIALPIIKHFENTGGNLSAFAMVWGEKNDDEKARFLLTVFRPTPHCL